MIRDIRNYRSLDNKEKDEVIELLLNHLGLVIVNPYEWGPRGVRLEAKDKEKPIPPESWEII